MIDEGVVQRYGDAFVNFAEKTVGVAKALEEFDGLRNIVRENPGFLEILRSPQISYADKCGFIDRVLKEGFSGEIKNFIKLLLGKGRIAKLLNIAEYIRVSYGGREPAVIRTSAILDLDLLKKVEASLEKKFKRKFKFYLDLDAGLLGGMQVVIGNTVIDGSGRKRLDELRERLIKVRV